VPPLSDVKAALSQAATTGKIKMKVDTVRGPTAPQEIKGELVSAMGELRDRNEKCYDVKKQVSLPITTNIIVMHSVVEENEAVNYTVWVEDTPQPLILAKVIVAGDSSMYDDGKLEEVLAEQEMILVGLSSYQEQNRYEVAKSWYMQTSRIYQPLSGGCIVWQKVPYKIVNICNSRQLGACASLQILILYLVPEQSVSTHICS
jgi:hypothetical protein